MNIKTKKTAATLIATVLIFSLLVILSNSNKITKETYISKDADYIDGRFPMHVIDLSENIIIKNTPAKIIFKVAVISDTDDIYFTDASKYRNTHNGGYGKYTFKVIESRIACDDEKYQSEEQNYLKISDVNMSIKRVKDYDFGFSSLEINAKSLNKNIYNSVHPVKFDILRTDKITGEEKKLSYNEDILFSTMEFIDDQSKNSKSRFSDYFYDRIIALETGELKNIYLKNLNDFVNMEILFQDESHHARICTCELKINYKVENLYKPEKSYISSYSELIDFSVEKNSK